MQSLEHRAGLLHILWHRPSQYVTWIEALDVSAQMSHGLEHVPGHRIVFDRDPRRQLKARCRVEGHKPLGGPVAFATIFDEQLTQTQKFSVLTFCPCRSHVDMRRAIAEV